MATTTYDVPPLRSRSSRAVKGQYRHPSREILTTNITHLEAANIKLKLPGLL